MRVKDSLGSLCFKKVFRPVDVLQNAGIINRQPDHLIRVGCQDRSGTDLAIQ